MELVKLYRLEIWDGCDRYNPNGFYLRYGEDAKNWKESHKWDNYTEITLKVCHSLEDLGSSSVAKIRESALAKLTLEERNALGF